MLVFFRIHIVTRRGSVVNITPRLCDSICAYILENISQTVSNTVTVTINDQ